MTQNEHGWPHTGPGAESGAAFFEAGAVGGVGAEGEGGTAVSQQMNG